MVYVVPLILDITATLVLTFDIDMYVMTVVDDATK